MVKTIAWIIQFILYEQYKRKNREYALGAGSVKRESREPPKMKSNFHMMQTTKQKYSHTLSKTCSMNELDSYGVVPLVLSEFSFWWSWK